MNRSSEKTCDIGQNMLYEFCYFFPFDLWTSYLAKIFFLQGCCSLFQESPSFTRIFNGLQYSFQVWQWFINVAESFSYKDFLFILTTQGKREVFFFNCQCKTRKPSITRQEVFRINSTFISDFLIYLRLFRSNKSDSSISRITILDFYYCFLSLWFIITYLGQL